MRKSSEVDTVVGCLDRRCMCVCVRERERERNGERERVTEVKFDFRVSCRGVCLSTWNETTLLLESFLAPVRCYFDVAAVLTIFLTSVSCFIFLAPQS